jgi:hypothetical protein
VINDGDQPSVRDWHSFLTPVHLGLLVANQHKSIAKYNVSRDAGRKILCREHLTALHSGGASAVGGRKCTEGVFHRLTLPVARLAGREDRSIRAEGLICRLRLGAPLPPPEALTAPSRCPTIPANMGEPVLGMFDASEGRYFQYRERRHRNM